MNLSVNMPEGGDVLITFFHIRSFLRTQMMEVFYIWSAPTHVFGFWRKYDFAISFPNSFTQPISMNLPVNMPKDVGKGGKCTHNPSLLNPPDHSAGKRSQGRRDNECTLAYCLGVDKNPAWSTKTCGNFYNLDSLFWLCYHGWSKKITG